MSYTVIAQHHDQQVAMVTPSAKDAIAFARSHLGASDPADDKVTIANEAGRFISLSELEAMTRAVK
jgi:hypothetical protein